MSVWRFADQIAAVPRAHQLTLGEGNTPLVRSRKIGPALGIDRLFFKLESSNPSGSYKDRFAAVAISAMLAAGKKRCIATSSGNTGAALAAYCAAAGIVCELAIVETAPTGKLSQMLAYGALLKRIRRFGVDAEVTRNTFARLQQLGESADAELEISAYRYCPVGMSGVQTISYELAEQAATNEMPIDHVFTPAGGGGLALAVARGLVQVRSTAAVHVVQPEGNNTIAGPLRQGSEQAQETVCTSRISGLQVPTVLDGNEVIQASRSSGGSGYLVSDEETSQLQAKLAREEGIFCEPAGAVALAGAIQAIVRQEVAADETVICLVTGSGFKDPAALEAMIQNCDCPMIDWTEL